MQNYTKNNDNQWLKKACSGLLTNLWWEYAGIYCCWYGDVNVVLEADMVMMRQ